MLNYIRKFLVFIFLLTSCAVASDFYISDITIPIRNGDTETALNLIDKHQSQVKDSKSLFELLKVSIKSNNRRVFDALLNYDFDFSTNDEDGRNLLIIASEQENLYYLNYILTKDISVDHKENDRDTAFSVSAATYNLPAMKLLIQNGAKDLDSHANNTSVPLNVAVAHQDVELVEMMLKRGADPNHQYEAFYREFPLQIAVEKGFPDIVALLLKHKADPNKLTCYGETALYLAQQKHEFAIDNDSKTNQAKIIATLKTYGAKLPEKLPLKRESVGSFRRPGC